MHGDNLGVRGDTFSSFGEVVPAADDRLVVGDDSSNRHLATIRCLRSFMQSFVHKVCDELRCWVHRGWLQDKIHSNYLDFKV